jgi:hypothetical protein
MHCEGVSGKSAEESCRLKVAAQRGFNVTTILINSILLRPYK